MFREIEHFNLKREIIIKIIFLFFRKKIPVIFIYKIPFKKNSVEKHGRGIL